MLREGVDLKRRNNLDLLDMAMSVLLEPLKGDPERLQTFIDDHLYAPLPRTAKARKVAQSSALAALGFNLEQAQALAIKDRERAQAEAAEAARRAAEEASAEAGPPSP